MLSDKQIGNVKLNILAGQAGIFNKQEITSFGQQCVGGNSESRLFRSLFTILCMEFTIQESTGTLLKKIIHLLK